MKSTTTTLIILSSLSVALLTAQADMLYWGGGTADMANNTALPVNTTAFAGAWNTTTKNWASSPSPGSYGAYVPGASVDLGIVTNLTASGGKVVITNQSDVSLSSLFAVVQASANQIISLTATSPKTLTLTGTNFILNVHAVNENGGLSFEQNVSLAGSAPISCTAPFSIGKVTVKSASDGFTGPVRVRNSEILVDGGTMAGGTDWRTLTQLHLQASSQAHSVPKLSFWENTSTDKNQINDNAAVTLSLGVFRYKGRDHATAPYSETLGKLVLEPFGVLNLPDINYATAGSPNPKLIFSDSAKGIDRGANGRGVLVVGVSDNTYSGVAMGYPTADPVVSNGVPTDVLLPWIATSRGEFMRVNGTTKILEPVPSTQAPTDPNTWVAGTDYRCGNSSAWTATATLTNNLSIHSLGFLPSTACTLTIGSGKTLNIAAGGITRQYANYANVATIITNGNLTSSSGQLTLTSGGASSYGSFTIFTAITGNVEVVKAGLGDIALKGPASNTYSGSTYLTGSLTANKSGSAVAIPGNLVIQNGGQFNANGTAPISATTAVTIEEGGVWNHGANSLIHGAPITLSGGCYYVQNMSPIFAAPGTCLVFNGGRITHYSGAYGSVSLQGNVSYAATSKMQALFQQFYGASGTFGVELDGAQRTFAITNSTTLADGVPEMVVDTRITPGSPAGGSLRKTGTGILQLTDNNTYTGGTVIDGGTLWVSKISALAQNNLTASFASYPCLVTFNQPVAKNMTVRQVIRTASNTAFKDSRNITEILNDYQIITTGTGNQVRSTDIIVDAISRSGSLGTGAATVNDTGTLKIDAGISLANDVTVNAGGTIDASGATIGSLTVNGGTVAATPSAGALSASGAVSLTDTALTLTGDVDNAPMTLLSAGSITGKFASIPEKVSVRYYPTYVTVERMKGLVIVVR